MIHRVPRQAGSGYHRGLEQHHTTSLTGLPATAGQNMVSRGRLVAALARAGIPVPKRNPG